MSLKSRWLYRSAALSVVAMVSLAVYTTGLTKPEIILADSSVSTKKDNPTLNEAIRVRSFIKDENIYLSEADINNLTMAFLDSSRKHNVDLDLLLSVAASESHFRADVVSRVGCIGIMQIKPSTARSFGIDPAQLYDPKVNIDLGARYLKQLLTKYNDFSLAVAAYNAGPSRVSTAVPAIRETRQYVSRVSNRRDELIALTQGIPGEVKID